MQKILSAFLAVCTAFMLTSCSYSNNSNAILDNSSNSYFVDFYTEGDCVYIECVLNIYNPGQETDVRINAIDNDDVEIGLLKSSSLTAVGKDNNSDIFTLKNGENEITVLFKGDYAGIYQITQREIPRFIKIEKA